MSNSTEVDPCAAQDLRDGDVAGMGVIISFILSNSITQAAITWAYWKRALRSERYNGIDELVLVILRAPSQPASPALVEAVEKFTLAMSDQQLVTGLAQVVVATAMASGAGNMDASWSAYSYSVAVSLALFAALTHVSSLTILREHLRSRRKLRLLRVAAIVVFTALLLVDVASGLSAQILNRPAYTVRCALSHPLPPGNWDAFIFTQVLICLVVVSAVAQRFWYLFGLDQTAPLGPRMAWYSCRLVGGDERSLLCAVVWRRAVLASHLRDDQPSNVPNRLRRLGLIMAEFFDSFLAQLIWLYIYFGFGLVVFAYNTILFWTEEDWPGLVPETEMVPQFRLSFGQVMPLILLLLPFLVAAETSKDVKNHAESLPLAETATVANAAGKLLQRPNINTEEALRQFRNTSDDTLTATALKLRTQHDPSRVLVYYHTALCRRVVAVVMVSMLIGYGYMIAQWFQRVLPGNADTTLAFIVLSGGLGLKVFRFSRVVLRVRKDMKDKKAWNLQ